jgi:hypothetical protein
LPTYLGYKGGLLEDCDKSIGFEDSLNFYKAPLS